MRFSNLFPAAILAAVAFAAPLPTPGEIEQPDGPAVVPGKATWFCTYSYELVFDHYTLEGHKWGLSEKEVRKLIPGTVTAWEWEKIEPGWSDFRATWALPIGMKGKVEKSLSAKVNDPDPVECHLKKGM